MARRCRERQGGSDVDVKATPAGALMHRPSAGSEHRADEGPLARSSRTGRQRLHTASRVASRTACACPTASRACQERSCASERPASADTRVAIVTGCACLGDVLSPRVRRSARAAVMPSGSTRVSSTLRVSRGGNACPHVPVLPTTLALSPARARAVRARSSICNDVAGRPGGSHVFQCTMAAHFVRSAGPARSASRQ